jgi:hypothetical protein
MLVRAAIFSLLTAATAAAADPIAVSFQQLLQKPRHYHNKTVAVSGYFDASEFVLHAKPGRAEMLDTDTIAVVFTTSQAKKLKHRGRLRSGFVHIVGTFEHIDMTPHVIKPGGKGSEEKDREIVEHAYGIWGIFENGITHIKEFEHAQ